MFSDVQANPVESNVTNGITAYRRGAHDGVIAFGGGSAVSTTAASIIAVPVRPSGSRRSRSFPPRGPIVAPALVPPALPREVDVRETMMAYGQAIPLQPGMLASAEIVFDRRSLLRWLFDPIYAVGRRS